MRLGSYLQKWITLSNAEKTLDGVCDLIVREQFINSCPRDLSIHLCERASQNLRQLAKIADQFLVARGKRLYTTFQSGKDEKPILKEGGIRGDYHPYMLQCFICRGYGHRAADCKLQMRAPRRPEKRCYSCQRQGHEAKDCWSSTTTANPFTQKAAGAVYRATLKEVLQDDSCHSNEKIEVNRHQTQTLKLEATEEEIQSCIEDDRLLLACGKTLPIVSNACIHQTTRKKCQ